jgi:AraC-like DNA-binding protein
MKDVLELPRGLDGWVWRYRFVRHAPHLHHHEELELNLVTAGTARYLVDDRRYDLQRNTLIWLFPAQQHVLLDQSDDYEMWIAVFRPRLLRDACTTKEARLLRSANPEGEFSRQAAERSSRRLEGLFAELAAAKDDAARFNSGISYALLTAWSVYQETAEATSGLDLHPAVERAARLIRQQEHDALSLNELAEQAGLSPSRLSRLFKRQTGVSLVRYRQRFQLERFLRLYAANQDRNMMHVALEAGFGSYPQFHRVFRQHMGYPPAEHLRRIMQDLPGRVRSWSRMAPANRLSSGST